MTGLFTVLVLATGVIIGASLALAWIMFVLSKEVK